MDWLAESGKVRAKRSRRNVPGPRAPCAASACCLIVLEVQKPSRIHNTEHTRSDRGWGCELALTAVTTTMQMPGQTRGTCACPSVALVTLWELDGLLLWSSAGAPVMGEPGDCPELGYPIGIAWVLGGGVGFMVDDGQRSRQRHAK